MQTRFIAVVIFAVLQISGVNAQNACTAGSLGCSPKNAPKSAATSGLKKAIPIAVTSPIAARDAQVRQDIRILEDAFKRFAKKNGGTFLLKDAGSGGVGAVDVSYGGLPTIVQGLHAAGVLKSEDLANLMKKPGYLFYLCDNDKRYSISATLEEPSAADIANAQKTCNATGPNGTFSVYNKNYAVGN